MKKNGSTIVFRELINNVGNSHINMVLSAVTMALKENVNVLVVDMSKDYLYTIIEHSLINSNHNDFKILLETNNLDSKSIDLYSDCIIEEYVSYVRCNQVGHVNNIIRHAKEEYDYIFIMSEEGQSDINSDIDVISLPRDLRRVKDHLSFTDQQSRIFILGEHNPQFKHENIKRIRKALGVDVYPISTSVNESLNKAIYDDSLVDFIIGSYDCDRKDKNFSLINDVLNINHRINQVIEEAIKGGKDEKG